MEWVESIGDSIELAKEHALDCLGVHEDDAEFNILNDVKTGVFGRIKEPARVRARVRPKPLRAKKHRRRGDRGNKGISNRDGSNRKSRDSGRKQQERSRKGEAQKSTAKGSKPQYPQDQKANQKKRTPKKPKDKEGTVNKDQETMPLLQQADIAEEFVGGLADCFGVNVDFQRQNIDSDEIRITVSGDQLGRMIGHRGITASAIDDLVRSVLRRRAGGASNGRVRVDIGGVVARRHKALIRFARDQAAEVKDSGAPRSLEPMSSADRKIVHDAVVGTTGVQTVSEGEDPRRYVVIVPSEE